MADLHLLVVERMGCPEISLHGDNVPTEIDPLPSASPTSRNLHRCLSIEIRQGLREKSTFMRNIGSSDLPCMTTPIGYLLCLYPVISS
uniref:Uncharacterized protein n=1 Tax=Oryza nivara TaxID=4536 RepID=A0A0E0GNH3_ORYNI